MRFEELETALDALADRVDAAADAATRDPATVKLRRYGPERQVVSRLELSGPERRLAGRRAGVDVHGDGSVEAYLGRLRRRALDPREGEGPLGALRRALSDP